MLVNLTLANIDFASKELSAKSRERVTATATLPTGEVLPLVIPAAKRVDYSKTVKRNGHGNYVAACLFDLPALTAIEVCYTYQQAGKWSNGWRKGAQGRESWQVFGRRDGSHLKPDSVEKPSRGKTRTGKAVWRFRLTGHTSRHAFWLHPQLRQYELTPITVKGQVVHLREG